MLSGTSLAGIVALVTGAGSGIGRAMAVTLAARGARLVLLGRDRAALADVAGRCAATWPPIVLPVDLTEDQAPAVVRQTVEGSVGGLDVLVHAAGVLARGPLESMPVAEFDRMYRTNLRAPFALTQALLPLLRAREGQVVFVNSTAGVSAAPQLGAYSALKHALRSMADTLRAEANPAGIRVVSVFPGRTATPMQARLHDLEGRDYRPDDLLQPEDLATAVVGALELPRTAEVTELRIRPLRRRNLDARHSIVLEEVAS